MKQTANYGLNQWDEQDRILRTDFNEDNAKLDAALQAKAEQAALAEVDTRLTSATALLQSSKLQFMTLGTFSNSFNGSTSIIATPAINYADYVFFSLEYSISLSSTSASCAIGTSKGGSSYPHSTDTSRSGLIDLGANSTRSPGALFFFPMKNPNALITCISYESVGVGGGTYRDLKEFHLFPTSSSAPFKGSWSITLRGVK